MRIPITIEAPEDRRRRGVGHSFRDYPHPSDPYGNRMSRTGRSRQRPSSRDRTNLAIDYDADKEVEVTAPTEEHTLREKTVPARTRDEVHKDAVHEEGQPEEWKNRYIRLRADFDNYKRHVDAERERLLGIGKAKVLEDIFPLVEHMERAIRATEDAGDQTGIREGMEMVYRELLKVLEKNGVERIETVGEPFDPEIHEAVAVSDHPKYARDTVVEEVRAGFVKGGKLLRPASVIVAQ